MAVQILHAAIEGMQGAEPATFENGEIKYEGYWHGCVETAARTLAFLFAETPFTMGEGIGIGDCVDAILPDLNAAIIVQSQNEKRGARTCEHCCQNITRDAALIQEEIHDVEHIVDDAAAAFFQAVCTDNKLLQMLVAEISKQQSNREAVRRVRRVRHEVAEKFESVQLKTHGALMRLIPEIDGTPDSTPVIEGACVWLGDLGVLEGDDDEVLARIRDKAGLEPLDS